MFTIKRTLIGTIVFCMYAIHIKIRTHTNTYSALRSHRREHESKYRKRAQRQPFGTRSVVIVFVLFLIRMYEREYVCWILEREIEHRLCIFYTYTNTHTVDKYIDARKENALSNCFVCFSFKCQNAKVTYASRSYFPFTVLPSVILCRTGNTCVHVLCELWGVCIGLPSGSPASKYFVVVFFYDTKRIWQPTHVQRTLLLTTCTRTAHWNEMWKYFGMFMHSAKIFFSSFSSSSSTSYFVFGAFFKNRSSIPKQMRHIQQYTYWKRDREKNEETNLNEYRIVREWWSYPLLHVWVREREWFCFFLLLPLLMLKQTFCYGITVFCR